MSAGEDRERRRRELEAAADKLFDALYPEDLAALVARYASLSALRDAVVDRAEKVADKLAKTDDPVTAEEYVLLIAACLTLGKKEAGVAKNTAHAVEKFRRYRRFAQTFRRHRVPGLPWGSWSALTGSSPMTSWSSGCWPTACRSTRG